MATTGQKVKLGVFVIFAGVLAAVLVGAMMQLTLFDDRDEYHVRIEDAGGLAPGAAVAVRGITVGRVADMRLFADDRESVRITLAVEPDTWINADAKAFIEREGLTGQRTVNIRGGTSDGESIAPGSYIPAGESVLDALPRRIDELMARATELLDSTGGLVEQLEKSVEAVDQKRIDRILANTESLAGTLAKTGKRLDRLVQDTRKPLIASLEGAEASFDRIERLAKSADRVVASIDRTVATLGGVVRENDQEVAATLRNLRRASASFETLARNLRNQPGLMLFGTAPPERELP